MLNARNQELRQVAKIDLMRQDAKSAAIAKMSIKTADTIAYMSAVAAAKTESDASYAKLFNRLAIGFVVAVPVLSLILVKVLQAVI